MRDKTDTKQANEMCVKSVQSRCKPKEHRVAGQGRDFNLGRKWKERVREVRELSDLSKAGLAKLLSVMSASQWQQGESLGKNDETLIVAGDV